jgi:hypothetical protein
VKKTYPDSYSNKTEKLYQGTQCPQQTERRNPASNQREFHRDDTGYGQPKCTGDTQEILRQQK